MNTTTISNSITHHEQDKFRTISLTALLTGILQIASIVLKYLIENGRGPLSLFKYIASGVFGKEALDGGILMITWGLVIHFMIAFLCTVFLFLIYPGLSRWLKNKFLTGALYGISIWAIMNFIVLPLSKINKLPTGTNEAILAASLLVLTIGMPTALIANWYYTKKKRA